jgi:hypothetical protein
MIREHFELKQTIVTILARKQEYIETAKDELSVQRRIIENYTLQDPLFMDVLEPYEVSQKAPKIIRKMALASHYAGIGPMASVAGALAEFAVKAMVNAGAQYAVIDNGGDIAFFVDQPLTVGIYNGHNRNFHLGLRFTDQNKFYSVCTSSSTVGPSISFGATDSTTIVGNDATLADAIATAVGNEITSKNDFIIKSVIENYLSIGIDGIIVVIDDYVGYGGDLPPIVKTKACDYLITKKSVGCKLN